jgi:hypothetical protein
MQNFLVVGMLSRDALHLRQPDESLQIHLSGYISPIGNGEIEARIEHLLWTCLTFVKTWDEVAPDVQHMYARCKPAQEASIEYVYSCQHQFDISGTSFRMNISLRYHG